MFFHIPFPEKKEELRPILEAHAEGVEGLLLEQALGVFTELRQVRSMTKKPTTAELIGWVEALRDVFQQAHVREALDRFQDPSGEAHPERLPWGDLPALGCLVKLREDLDRLGVRAQSSP